ncbi:MAG: type II secretion system protein N [Aeromonas sp.]
MRNKVIIALVFSFAFAFFLLLQVPANLALRALPAQYARSLKIEGVSGTLWQGQASRVQYGKEVLAPLSWDLNGWSLLRAAPSAAIKFGSRNTINGQGIVGWNNGFTAEEFTLNMPAAELLRRLAKSLPFPLTVGGQTQLKLHQFVQAKPWCQQLDGKLNWYNATFSGPMGEVALADPTITLSCPEGKVIAEIKQQSDAMALTGRFTLETDGMYLFQGQLKAGKSLPAAVEKALSMLGQPDAQGRFPLRYQGKIKP